MSNLDDLIKRAHLKTCGSNRRTDCDDDCSALKESATEELARLRDVAEKAERFIRADGRHDPPALYLELRRCFLDDK